MTCLAAEGLARFESLQRDAVDEVTDRFYAEHGSAYERFGASGRAACRDDLGRHLEFLHPVLEFGLIEPMVDYLLWLSSVLEARSIPAEHLGQSLEWLADFYARHMSGEDGAVVNAALLDARARFLEASSEPVSAPVPPESWPEAAAFESALLVGDQREAIAVMNRAVDAGHTLSEIEVHVFQAALYHIGEGWQANRVTVAQEHMASAIVQSVMTLALLRFTLPPSNGQRALLACVEGNHHVIGLRMVADAFQISGWDVQFLGADVPTRSIVQQVFEWQPVVVGLSTSFPQQLRPVQDLIAQLDKAMGSARPPVIVGGLAINRFRQLARIAGADFSGEDPQAAVAYANRIVSV